MNNKLFKEVFWPIIAPVTFLIGTGLTLRYIQKGLFSPKSTGKELADKASIL